MIEDKSMFVSTDRSDSVFLNTGRSEVVTDLDDAVLPGHTESGEERTEIKDCVSEELITAITQLQSVLVWFLQSLDSTNLHNDYVRTLTITDLSDDASGQRISHVVRCKFSVNFQTYINCCISQWSTCCVVVSSAGHQASLKSLGLVWIT